MVPKLILITLLCALSELLLAPINIINGLMSNEVNYTSIALTWLPVNCFKLNSSTNYSILYSENGIVYQPISTKRTSLFVKVLFPGTLYTFHAAVVSSHETGPSSNYTISTKIPRGMPISVCI